MSETTTYSLFDQIAEITDLTFLRDLSRFVDRRMEILADATEDDRTNFAMFSDEGNAAVLAEFGYLERAVEAGACVTPEDFGAAYATLQCKVAAAGHPEVTDTAVREILCDHIERVAERHGIHLSAHYGWWIV